MIQKIIHIYRFGGVKYPDDIKFYLDRWKQVLPDFQSKVWNKGMVGVTDVDANVIVDKLRLLLKLTLKFFSMTR